jgi:hypothetical protein
MSMAKANTHKKSNGNASHLGCSGDVVAVKRLQTDTTAELDAFLQAVLDRAFKGELR